ncbi:unnamed protein product, partial [Nippostrongylus brasiliensis]|uniref:Secreted protein n=1 Tax=Nippostrongylus brasiliensis TaxID=27835 RepID=A0A0N4XE39_NIPBR
MQLLQLVVCVGLATAFPQLGKRTNYDEVLARKLLNMAAGAYGEQKEDCINRSIFCSHLLCLQGQLLLEGLQAINPLVKFFEMGSVNKYFLNGHLVLWPPIERTLNDANYAVSIGYRITITGH